MWKYPDNTYRINPPTRIEHGGYIRKFNDLTRKEVDEVGFNEAIPVERPPFTTYTTEWKKGDDLISREVIVTTEVDEEAKATHEAKSIRAERDRRLAASDWTQLADCPLSAGGKSAWTAYRQTLRDLPQQDGFPGRVTWPDVPE